MLKQVEIEGFRGISRLALKNLARINVIVGANSTGKTSVLEALFLLAIGSNPEKSFLPNMLRGLSRDTKPLEMTRWLFADGDMTRVVRLSALEPRNIRRVLKISFDEMKSRRIDQSDEVRESDDPRISATHRPALRIDFSRGRIKSTAFATFEQDGEVLAHGRTAVLPTSLLISAHSRAVNLERFSMLVQSGEHESIIECVSRIHTQIRQLEILTSLGRPLLFARLENNEYIPLQLIGDGALRAVNAIVTTLSAKNGMVMLDEFENGLSLDSQLIIWRALRAAAARANAQIFATTHSLECLRSALDSSREVSNLTDLAIHRIERDGDQVRVVTIGAEEARAMVARGMDMR